MESPDINKEFLSELKRVYQMIDKDAELLWSHRNESEIIRGTRAKSTRSNLRNEAKE